MMMYRTYCSQFMFMSLSAWFFVTSIFTVGNVDAKRNDQYRGDKVYEVKQNFSDTEKIEKIRATVNNMKMDVWKDFNNITNSCFVHVKKSQNKRFVEYCKTNKINYREDIKNLKINLDENMKSVATRGKFDYNMYNRYEDIVRELYSLARCNRNVMSVSTIGLSSEGRPLLLVKLSYDLKYWLSRYKPIIWIDAGMHAREWISQASALFMVNRILNLRGQDVNVTRLLQQYRVFIVPVFNPDGYVYSMDEDRLWRKTRTKIPGTECVGIDPNRNFDIKWGGVGSSSDPCSIVFRGQRPEDEPVVRAYVKQMKCYKRQLVAYFSLHSFLQLLLTPKFYTMEPPDDLDEIVKFALAFRDGSYKRFKTPYSVGPSSKVATQGILTGTGADYVHEVLGVTHSYTLELRDRGTFKFLLPADQIAPTAIEALDGIMEGIFTVDLASKYCGKKK